MSNVLRYAGYCGLAGRNTLFILFAGFQLLLTYTIACVVFDLLNY